MRFGGFHHAQLTVRFLAACSLCFAAPAAAVHADDAGVKQDVQAAYNKRDAALNHFDIEGYLAAYNTNYKNVTGAKPGTTDRQRQAVISQLQHSQRLTRHDTVESVTPFHDGVTVLTTAVTDRFVASKKTGKVSHMVQTDHTRAFWVDTKSGWRIKQERMLDSQTAMAGSAAS